MASSTIYWKPATWGRHYGFLSVFFNILISFVFLEKVFSPLREKQPFAFGFPSKYFAISQIVTTLLWTLSLVVPLILFSRTSHELFGWQFGFLWSCCLFIIPKKSKKKTPNCKRNFSRFCRLFALKVETKKSISFSIANCNPITSTGHENGFVLRSGNLV